MERPKHEMRPWWKRGGYWGALIGCCGWWISWVFFCLYYQAYEPLLRLALPSLLITVGFGLQFILVIELVMQRVGLNHRGLVMFVIWGFPLTTIGTGLLALEKYIEPAMAKYPVNNGHMGGFWGNAWCLLLVGGVLSSIGTVLVLRVDTQSLKQQGDSSNVPTV